MDDKMPSDLRYILIASIVVMASLVCIAVIYVVSEQREKNFSASQSAFSVAEYAIRENSYLAAADSLRSAMDLLPEPSKQNLSEQRHYGVVKDLFQKVEKKAERERIRKREKEERERIKEANTGTTCPRCGSQSRPVPILYGLPTQWAMAAADRGDVWLGGCVVQKENWFCPRCESRWVE